MTPMKEENIITSSETKIGGSEKRSIVGGSNARRADDVFKGSIFGKETPPWKRLVMTRGKVL